MFLYSPACWQPLTVGGDNTPASYHLTFHIMKDDQYLNIFV